MKEERKTIRNKHTRTWKLQSTVQSTLEFISEQEDFYDDAIKPYMKDGNIKELYEKLCNVSDSYKAFVVGIIIYAATDKSREEKVLAYMNEHPDARASDITKFVMSQEDFHEAARSTRRDDRMRKRSFEDF